MFYSLVDSKQSEIMLKRFSSEVGQVSVCRSLQNNDENTLKKKPQMFVKNIFHGCKSLISMHIEGSLHSRLCITLRNDVR